MLICDSGINMYTILVENSFSYEIFKFVIC